MRYSGWGFLFLVVTKKKNAWFLVTAMKGKGVFNDRVKYKAVEMVSVYEPRQPYIGPHSLVVHIMI